MSDLRLPIYSLTAILSLHFTILDKMQCHNMSLHGTESAAGIDTVDCIRKATKNVFSDFQTT